MSDAVQRPNVQGPLVDRAVRLFEFLARAQQLKQKPPRTLDAYQRDGSVLWFADLPEHPAVTSAHRGGDPEPADALFSLDRVPRLDPPALDDALTKWVNGALDDPAEPPWLRDAIQVPIDASQHGYDQAEGQPSRELRIDDQPEVRDRYEQWRDRWEIWAEQERIEAPVRTLYRELFSTYVRATGHPEELELVVGVGCLAWHPADHPAVRRHLLTAPVSINFDDNSGRLTVARVEAIDAAHVELDMLDPGLVTNPGVINDVRDAARVLEAHPLHREEAGSLVRRLVQTLDAEGRYSDDDTPPQIIDSATAAFAPALILRKRSQQGLVDIFNSIVSQLAASGVVPDGVLPLVDPNHVLHVEADNRDGALVMVDGDPFLPLPVNDVQLRIINQVDKRAQTLVQGPPGTGKTHTAAALISHLLAQGKRVLITAHTDRALKEVRDKLPAAIRPLSVAVVGTSREDMSNLKVAVERIGATAAEHDPSEAQARITGCLANIDTYRRQRAGLYRRLVDARQAEVIEHERGGYRGTLAAIAQQLQADTDRFGWIRDHVKVAASSTSPLDDDEIREWRGYLLDTELIADEQEAGQRLLEVPAVPSPGRFADLAAAERTAASVVDDHEHLRGHAAFEIVSHLDAEVRADLQGRLHLLAEEADSLARRREEWMNDALVDVRSGRAGIWQARARQIGDLIDKATPLVEQLGPLAEVEVRQGEVAPLAELAKALDAYLEGGGSIKTTHDGAPKRGVFLSKAVRQAESLFAHVRVDGLPPTTREQLAAFLAWYEITKTLAALDRAWPENVAIPSEDTLHERLQWHITELEQLCRVVALGEELQQEEQRLAELSLPRPDWNDLAVVHIYASLVDAAAANDALLDASAPLAELEATLAEAGRWADAATAVHQMVLAVDRRDHDLYAQAHARMERLEQVRRLQARRDELGAELLQAAPDLHEAITEAPNDPAWEERLATFAEAWDWAATAAWVLQQDTADGNALQAEVAFTEERIRREVETLSATRAWSYAVAPSRLTGQARANLEQYAYLVRRLGKGTGKYAIQQKAEIRQAMDRCRTAVPVWIMPVYRIAEQLRIEPDMFDVVIVDEASQAGLEATFLQYLAPKMVVIGDDKQVSPTAVGVDEQALRDLAAQYLADDPYRSSWQAPQRSLFDEAKMRFSGLLTLTEHRRCVPEIIGFSNRVAYEPDGIRLIPVRQYGIDRLDPIKAVFVSNGYTRGSTNKINPCEVDAVVEQIEKCIADPRYDGLTFGVISLLGSAQAKAIQKELLERIAPEEWDARDLRCGDSADFQGSQRDVMFLSMVAAPEPGKPMVALTRDLYVQRYNVAASRAKDQMWLYHSVRSSDLGNPEDMRFQLLDYCYGVVNRLDSGVEGAVATHVPDDVRVDPFDSLFEQRVFNRLLDRGYTVIPQYPVEPYRLDLVVVGAKSRLAIECDGDEWHGPDAYERDLARQRDLERCGWQFFRLRESTFYVDPGAALEELWRTLQELEIHPSGWEPDDEEDAEATAARPDDDQHDVPLSDLAAVFGEHAAAAEATPEGSEELAVPASPIPTPTAADPAIPADDDSEASSHDAEDTPALAPRASSAGRLNNYIEFAGKVVPVPQASGRELIDGIAAIVAVEGPVVGHRLHSAYVRAAGGQRVGKQIAKALNSAITAGVRQGALIEDNPLSEPGVKPRTYRLPGQPAVAIRDLGPRPLEHVPPKEVATLIADLAEQHGWEHEETLFRAVLDELGLKRLTTNVSTRLARILPLARTVADS